MDFLVQLSYYIDTVENNLEWTALDRETVCNWEVKKWDRWKIDYKSGLIWKKPSILRNEVNLEDSLPQSVLLNCSGSQITGVNVAQTLVNHTLHWC